MSRFFDSRFSKITGSLLAILLAAIVCLPPATAKTPIAEFGKNKVKLEVAQTPEQIQRGLMFRQSMPEDAGMVFLFRPPRPVRFWMYHCFISLDMIFIKDGKIAKIAANVPPCRSPKPEGCPVYPTDGEIEVSEVVEVNSGYCKRHGIKEGDAVKFSMEGMENAAAVSEGNSGSAGATASTDTNSADGASEKAGTAGVQPESKK